MTLSVAVASSGGSNGGDVYIDGEREGEGQRERERASESSLG